MRALALAGLVLFLAGGAGAAAPPAAEPGVGAGTIVIGGLGPAPATLAAGARAYFDRVNAQGGVHGRRIEYRFLETDGSPESAVEAAQRLIDAGAFAFFATAGTAESLAVRSLLSRTGVPQLLVDSAVGVWGRGGASAIGFRPTHRLEAEVVARHLLRTRPRARIGVVYSLGPDGKELLGFFRRALGSRGTLVVQAVPLDLSIARLEDLRAAGADTLVNLTDTPLRASWAERIYATGLVTGAPAPGTIAPVFVKEPTDPRWARDAGLAPFRPLRRSASVRGLAAAFTLVGALREAGPQPTRAGLVRAVRSLNEAANPFLVPGIVVRTGPRDRWPIEQVALQRFVRGRWQLLTGLFTLSR